MIPPPSRQNSLRRPQPEPPKSRRFLPIRRQSLPPICSRKTSSPPPKRPKLRGNLLYALCPVCYYPNMVRPQNILLWLLACSLALPSALPTSCCCRAAAREESKRCCSEQAVTTCCSQKSTATTSAGESASCASSQLKRNCRCQKSQPTTRLLVRSERSEITIPQAMISESPQQPSASPLVRAAVDRKPPPGTQRIHATQGVWLL